MTRRPDLFSMSKGSTCDWLLAYRPGGLSMMVPSLWCPSGCFLLDSRMDWISWCSGTGAYWFRPLWLQMRSGLLLPVRARSSERYIYGTLVWLPEKYFAISLALCVLSQAGQWFSGNTRQLHYAWCSIIISYTIFYHLCKEKHYLRGLL